MPQFCLLGIVYVLLVTSMNVCTVSEDGHEFEVMLSDWSTVKLGSPKQTQSSGVHVGQSGAVIMTFPSSFG